MLAWLRLSLRRLRDERASAVGMFLLVLFTTLVAVAAPRLLDRAADGALQAELATQTPAARTIQLLRQAIEVNGVPTADDPLAPVSRAGKELFDTIPDDVQNVIDERAIVIDSGRWHVTKPTKDPSFVRFRIQPGAEKRIHVVQGRLPEGAVSGTSQPTFEVALSRATAAALDVGVGDSLPLEQDGSDPLVGRFGGIGTAAVLVVGIYEVDDPNDPWWLGDPGLTQPVTRSLGGDNLVLDMGALLGPAAYPALLTTHGTGEQPFEIQLRYTFREYVDPTRLHERDLDRLVPALRRLEAQYPSPNVQQGGGNTALRTGLRAFLDGHVARWSAATAVLTVIAIGPAAVAAAALGMLAALAARRRRAAMSLSRGRGASIGQVLAAVVTEGLLVAAPAAAVGTLVALLALPDRASLLPIATAALIGVVAVGLFVAATVPATGGPGFGTGREVSVPRRPTPRRLVFEALVVGLAVVGAVLLRDRGIRGGSAAGALTSADPTIAAVPALVGLAAGLLAVRLLPLPMALLARAARAGRGLVGLLAMRRAGSGGAAPVLLVLLATSTIGAFSAAALVHLDRSAETAAWNAVGADYRVRAVQGSLRVGFDFKALPGVEAAATMFTGTATITARGAPVALAALDVADYERVVAGTPAAEPLPIDFFDTGAQPLPVIASTAIVNRAGGLPLGEAVSIAIQGYTFPIRVVQVRDSFPGIDAPLFVVISRDQIHDLFPEAPLQPTVAFLRAPPTAADGIREQVNAAMSLVAIDGRAERTLELRDAPIANAIRLGIAAAGLVAAVYAGLAVAAALALAGAARSIELAHLRTLGLSGDQAARLILVEQGPTVLIAFAAGLALGLGLFAILVPGLGLEALVGVPVDVPLGLEPGLLLIMAAGVAAVVSVGLGLGILMERRAAPVAALRRGFE